MGKRIARACSRTTGTEVGSCDPLPDCVIASAQDTGHELARNTYGVKSVCGNGKLEPGETCHDGPLHGQSAACTEECQIATYGDGKVESGVEDCDNGKKNGRNFDTCSCTATCRATRSECGD